MSKQGSSGQAASIHNPGNAPRGRLARARHLLPRGQTLPERAWRRRHRSLLILLWLHVPAIPIYSLVQGYGIGHSLLEGVPVAGLALLAGAVANRKLASAFVSLGLLTCSALVVHLSSGVTEAHFYYFVMVVALTLYEDWTPFLIAVGFVLLQHGLTDTLTDTFFDDATHGGKSSWWWALIHALFVGAAGAAAVMAWRLNEEVRHNLRAVVDGSGDAILEIDRDGCIAAANPAAVSVLGYSSEELEGRKVTTLLGANAQGVAGEVVDRVEQGEHISDYETVWRRADGSPVNLSMTISPITDVTGRVTSASIFARDITEAKRQSAALAEAESRFRGAFDDASIGMSLVAPDGRWIQVNAALAEILGYSSDELMQKTFQDVTHPDDLDLDLENVRRVLDGEVPNYKMEKRYIRRDGRVVWVNLSVSLVRDGEGQPLYFISQVEDITERHEAVEQLRFAEERYRNLVERVPAITYVAEAGESGRWQYVSPQIERVLGYTPQEWMDDPTLWFSRVHPDDRERVLLEEGARGPYRTEYRMYARDGRLLWVRDEAVFRSGEEADFMDGILTDVTERKLLEEQLRHMATHDQMTGLHNRGRFEEELRHAAASIRRYGSSGAVLLLDLDSFKEVNDSLGHQAGDRLLKGVAGILSSRLRETDTVARLGGDEFAIFLPHTEEDEAKTIAEDLVQRVRSHRLDVGGTAVQTTVSIGIALLAESAEPAAAERLLMEADIAMYEAKAAGGDGVACFRERDATGAGV